MDSYSGSIFQWRLGTESQYVSIYWCPTELHRVVRPLFRLKWPPKVRLLLGLKGHGGPWVSLLFKVSTLSHGHGGQKALWAFMHMTRPIKEHHPSTLLHIFPLFLSNVFECYKKKGGLIVCCGSQIYSSFPPFPFFNGVLVFHGKKLMNTEQKANLNWTRFTTDGDLVLYLAFGWIKKIGLIWTYFG